jgi:copper resistance protein C
VTRFRTARIGLVGLLAAAAVGLGAIPASAHTALESSDPKADAEVAPPTEITLTYTETVRLPRVVLTGPDGARQGLGTPTASGDTVTQPLNGTLANGTYTVGWRVVSADGHPVTGTYKFTVKGSPGSTGASAPVGDAAQAPSGPAPSTSASSAPTDPASTSPAASQSTDGSSSGWLWIGLGALVVVLAVGGVAWARRSPQD